MLAISKNSQTVSNNTEPRSPKISSSFETSLEIDSNFSNFSNIITSELSDEEMEEIIFEEYSSDFSKENFDFGNKGGFQNSTKNKQNENKKKENTENCQEKCFVDHSNQLKNEKENQAVSVKERNKEKKEIKKESNEENKKENIKKKNSKRKTKRTTRKRKFN